MYQFELVQNRPPIASKRPLTSALFITPTKRMALSVTTTSNTSIVFESKELGVLGLGTHLHAAPTSTMRKKWRKKSIIHKGGKKRDCVLHPGIFSSWSHIDTDDYFLFQDIVKNNLEDVRAG